MRAGALVAGAVTATLVLSACGGGGTTSDNSSKSNGQKGASGFNAALTGVINPSDKKGGTLKLTIHDTPDSLDPAIAYYAQVWNLMKGFYVRSLLTNDAKPGKDGLKLVPDLATDMPAIEDGGLTYTFKIRPGLFFTPDPAFKSARRELTAADYGCITWSTTPESLRAPAGAGA